VSAFGFKGPDQQENRPACCPAVNANRLNLALTLKEGGNLILLDEPTNDLDVGNAELVGETRWRTSRAARW